MISDSNHYNALLWNLGSVQYVHMYFLFSLQNSEIDERWLKIYSWKICFFSLDFTCSWRGLISQNLIRNKSLSKWIWLSLTRKRSTHQSSSIHKYMKSNENKRARQKEKLGETVRLTDRWTVYFLWQFLRLATSQEHEYLKADVNVLWWSIQILSHNNYKIFSKIKEKI